MTMTLQGGSIQQLGGIPPTLGQGMGGAELFQIDGPSKIYNVIIRNTYFDLHGYTMEDETVFPQAVVLQNVGAGPITTGTVGDSPIEHLSIVSMTPIRNSDFSVDDDDRVVYPGMMRSTFDLQHIVQGRLESWSQTNTLNQGIITEQNVWGAGTATAGPKLYVTEAWVLDEANGYTLSVPDIAYIIPINTDKESKMEYVYRQARSLEPQQQV